MGACLTCDLRGEVGRPVVDDEHFRVRELLVQLLEDGGKVLLLVPCGDEDERVVTHCARVTPREADGAGRSSRYLAADPTPRRRR